MFRIEVDGTTHRVDRDDGGVVRAGWPAFVVSVLVQAGDRVAEGDPVAVLESMKMESTVTAPYSRRGGRGRGRAQRPGQRRCAARCASVRPSRPAARPSRRRPLDLAGLEARPGPGDPTVRAGLRRPAQLPPRLRPRPGDAAAAARRAAPARRDQPARRPRPAALRGRAARPVRRGRRALPPADRDPARRRTDRRPAPRSTCSPTCSGWTPTGPGCPTPIASVSRRRSPATASTGSSARPSSRRRWCGCSAPSAASASWSRS